MTTLDGAHQFHLDVLPPAQAIRLLGKLSGNARLDSEPGATEDLARQCDYLPLALRIAGARLAARLFRLLGLHRGTDVGVWTAAALLDSSSAIAEAALEQLVDAQLLETPTRRRYRMHSLLLLFAREQADRDEPEAGRKAAIRRMLDCYLATRIFAELEDDLWEYVSIGVLGAALREQGRLDRAIGCLERSRWHFHRIHNPAGESAALNNLGLTYSDQGHFAAAIDCLDQSLRICRESGNLFGEAVAISNLGEAHYRAGAPGAAIKFYERSLVIHREMRDRCREAETLWRLGWVRDALGQPAQARSCWNAAKAIFKELGMPPPTEKELQRTAWW